MTLFTEPRKQLVDWVRQQLIGPPTPVPDGPELQAVLPTERFPCGTLYPISQEGEGVDPLAPNTEDMEDIEQGEGQGYLENEKFEKTSPVHTRRYIPPSSLGFSFFIQGENIQFQVLCRGVYYMPVGERNAEGRYIAKGWTRKELASGRGDSEDVEHIICPRKAQRQTFVKLDKKARIDVQWRSFADGWIVTVSLCNAQQLTEGAPAKDYAAERAEKTLFETGLRCVIEAGSVGDYPRVARHLLDEEEQELEIQYAHRHIYAIGHGCAANWKVENDNIIEIHSEAMPAVEVPQMTADTGTEGDGVLSLAQLARMDKEHENLLPQLDEFIGGYAHWVHKQQDSVHNFDTEDQVAAARIVKRMECAVARMRTSLNLLACNAKVRDAFAIANTAMLDQMRQYDIVRGMSDDSMRGMARADETYRWRPFQLAFLLTVLESSANGDSDFRDTVDLIWFPTGGGKTEAYLGLIAFQIALRRLSFPDNGGGTTVIMRYTLRLLTRDQFLRATRLICALERIRRKRKNLGTEPITIGMWVGSATSPNTFQEAKELLHKAIASNTNPQLVLDHCPWCGEKFSAQRNYKSTERSFHFLCQNPDCDFGGPQNILPCNVVDAALYDTPPTMLLATIDKFARLAWEERANAFFGAGRYLPPELIIQDELHLIASALGSVAGLYEAALDTVVQLSGIYPKYIASTATIRMAEQQVKQLYGRELAVFPPSGLNCDDSYFARIVPLEERAGRMYVGYLAPMLNSQQCLAPLAAALLLAPHALFKNSGHRQELLDAWWTQMLYHSSLAGVGNSHTAFSSDIPYYIKLFSGIAGEQDEQDEQGQPDEQAIKQGRSIVNIEQLTSLQEASENAKIFSQLARKHGEPQCLDAVMATNMISVGLDVGRLALMIINGQPLTTAEYIQASSRVGRSEVPGVVFANYYRNQARSLSHYESFRPYHEAFYRFVEPTSVTPYTYQARQRALSAALVIVMRHGKTGLLANGNAGQFNPEDSQVVRAVNQLKKRCTWAAPDLEDTINEHIDMLLQQWQYEVGSCTANRRKLDYHVPSNDNGRNRLLYNHTDTTSGLWPTLQSLRNVENSALLKVL